MIAMTIGASVIFLGRGGSAMLPVAGDLMGGLAKPK